MTAHNEPARGTDRGDSVSVAGQLSGLASDVAQLFRGEVDLFKAETEEKLKTAVRALGTLVAGAVLALAALIVLLQALVIAITEAGVPAGWASLGVGVVVAIIGFIAVRQGMSGLEAKNLAPRRTAHSLQRDAETIQEHVTR